MTSDMAISCLNDSNSLTKCCGIKNVSNGRNAIIERLKHNATLAHTSAARLAHGLSWNSPMPVLIPEKIRKEGTVAMNNVANGCSS